jgi:hypothetical protein
MQKTICSHSLNKVYLCSSGLFERLIDSTNIFKIVFTACPMWAGGVKKTLVLG